MVHAFCHIPKTAGTTLNYVLRKNFKHKMVSIEGNKLYDNAMFETDIKKFPYIQLIAGHSLKPHILLKKDIKWFTVLRNPIKRTISQYVHQYTSGDEKYKVDFLEWIDTYKNRANWQVRWLGGENNLELALHNLRKFNFVGLTERFDESLLLLGANFGFTTKNLYYGSKKMTQRNSELSQEIYAKYKDELENLNSLDIQLYNEAVILFNKQVADYGEEKLKNNLKNFISINAVKSSNKVALLPYFLHQKLVYNLIS